VEKILKEKGEAHRQGGLFSNSEQTHAVETNLLYIPILRKPSFRRAANGSQHLSIRRVKTLCLLQTLHQVQVR
jgi:hypothetical protein